MFLIADKWIIFPLEENKRYNFRREKVCLSWKLESHLGNGVLGSRVRTLAFNDDSPPDRCVRSRVAVSHIFRRLRWVILERFVDVRQRFAIHPEILDGGLRLREIEGTPLHPKRRHYVFPVPPRDKSIPLIPGGRVSRWPVSLRARPPLARKSEERGPTMRGIVLSWNIVSDRGRWLGGNVGTGRHFGNILREQPSAPRKIQTIL